MEVDKQTLIKLLEALYLKCGSANVHSINHSLSPHARLKVSMTRRLR